jgi:GNAT superfamily N-acetyltransferase
MSTKTDEGPLPWAPSGGATQAGRELLQEGLRVDLAAAEDREEQGLLYDLCFDKDDGTRALPWRYDGCPHGITIAPVARDTSDRMVASYACSPRRVRFRGQDPGAATVGQTGDVMTDPGLRSRGVFSALHWRAMEEARRRGWPAAWGLPNKHSGPIFFGKLGWELAGHIGPWNFVLRADRRARQVRLQNGKLAMAATPWAAWRGAHCRARLRARGGGLEVGPLERFPVEVADLSELVEPRFDWMVHRDAPYLNWRFMQAPSRAFKSIGVWDRAGTLVGYAVVQRTDGGQAVGIISDLLGLDSAAEGAALDGAIGALAGMGAAIVRAYAMRDSHWEGVLARGGFRRPRGYKPVGAYGIHRDHPLAGATLKTSSWYFMDGDRDTETVR